MEPPRSAEETGEGTQEVGGPRSTSRKRTTMEVVVRFHHLSSHPPLLTSLACSGPTKTKRHRPRIQIPDETAKPYHHQDKPTPRDHNYNPTTTTTLLPQRKPNHHRDNTTAATTHPHNATTTTTQYRTTRPPDNKTPGERTNSTTAN